MIEMNITILIILLIIFEIITTANKNGMTNLYPTSLIHCDPRNLDEGKYESREQLLYQNLKYLPLKK